MAKYKNKWITAGAIIAVLLMVLVWSSACANSGDDESANLTSEKLKSEQSAEDLPEQDGASSDLSSADNPAGTPEEGDPAGEDNPPADKLPASSAISSAGIEPKSSSTLKQTGHDDSGKDKYQTEPVPQGKPAPVEPQSVTPGQKAYTCTLSVRCDTILDNMNKLNPDKKELVPSNGVIFPKTTVTFYEGESVFNVLQREMKQNKIHMTFRNTPIYNAAYIEAINNLYEFDCGELSGWMYKVNGWFPNYGCSRYQLKQGDVIEFIYTCDLGKDIGGDYAAGDSQKQ